MFPFDKQDSKFHMSYVIQDSSGVKNRLGMRKKI
jgi:hypothetical protein